MSLPVVELNMAEGGEIIRAIDTQPNPTPPPKRVRWSLVLLYLAFAAVGSIGGPLLQRLYFIHGGNRIWLSSWLSSVGFPFLVAPLSFIYLTKSTNTTASVFFMEPKLFISSLVIGVLLGFDNYMYALGLSLLPVSTSSLLLSTQLAFTAFFAFLLVKQRFTCYSINSVVLMSLGAIMLALHTSSDRPPGVTKGKYFLGFFITLATAVLLGMITPLVELAYSKSKKPFSYMVVMQFQVVMSFSATMVATVGMLINKDFEIIQREAKEFGLGKIKYYLVLVSSAIMWQVLSLGLMGIINCCSSLFAGIVTAVLLPLTQLSGVIVFHEEFTSEKGMSLALCLWGFISYFVGEYKKAPKNTPINDVAQGKY